MPETVPKRLSELTPRAEAWSVALRSQEEQQRFRGRALGATVSILGVVTGSAIFASLGDNPNTWARVAIAVVSLIAAAGAAAQTALAYPEEAGKAHRSAMEFGKLYGQMLNAQDKITQKTDAEIDELCDRYETFRQRRPPVSERIKKRVSRQLGVTL
jgi:hypothetical protein